MLLRSSSTPILNSWIRTSTNDATSFPSPDPDFLHHAPKSRPLTLTASSPSSASESSTNHITRALSETDLRDLSSLPKRRSLSEAVIERDTEGDDDEDDDDLDRLMMLTTTGLGKAGAEEEEQDGGGGGDGGPGILGFRSGSGDGKWGGSDATERYYLNMIQAHPANSLLLGNYARFLKEVRGDYVRAEEYCGRAILVNPNDGNLLSLYADLTWELHNDASRAELYFNQAAKAAPDDCYVMASYAKFLWDAEEDEEEESGGSALPSYIHPISASVGAVS